MPITVSAIFFKARHMPFLIIIITLQMVVTTETFSFSTLPPLLGPLGCAAFYSIFKNQYYQYNPQRYFITLYATHVCYNRLNVSSNQFKQERLYQAQGTNVCAESAELL